MMETKNRYEAEPVADLSDAKGLTQRADLYRADASRHLDPDTRSERGQFFTPPAVAQFMASMFKDPVPDIRLLDAGAAVGTLTAAFVEDACQRSGRPGSITVVAYELEPLLAEHLRMTLSECQEECEAWVIQFTAKLVKQDFVQVGVEMLRGGLFPVERYSFNRAILNPPYKKIRSDSLHRRLLSSIGIEATNFYAAFLVIAADLLEPGAELVAITPRSFCNGPYFKPFRRLLLDAMALRQIHVFESREQTFKVDDVLQENILFHAIKGGAREQVIISSSHSPTREGMTTHTVDYEQVLRPGDPDLIIHLVTGELDEFVLDRVSLFQNTLKDLDVEVSTGRVVDFRAKDFLRADPNTETAPLIYPTHFRDGFIHWPKPGKKPNAIVQARETEPLFLPAGYYVLVKRFSAKEEPRRVVAAINDPERVSAPKVAFENHVNVYHRRNAGLPRQLAKGLALFMNSTLVDSYFRQFNGALTVLEALGLPKGQLNERSALTLLALLELGPNTSWTEARDPQIGITPIMDFCRDQYGKNYAPNTRETFRKQTMHQFVDAGFVVANPDEPQRAVNSPKFCYQIEPVALKLFRAFGTANWAERLTVYLQSRETSKQRYARIRQMQMVPVTLADGKEVYLTPGELSTLVQAVLEEFAPRFVPGGHVLYVGDTGNKWRYFDKASLEALGVTVDGHGKMPDVIIHHVDKDWLVLVEAVTSHGLVDAKRRQGLSVLFQNARPGLIYVTAFLARSDMGKYIGEISWETEVWVREAGTHLIHFDGERFLGPYER